MKNLWIALCLVMLAGTTELMGAFSFVQTQKAFNNTNTGSVTATFGSNYATGHIILVAASIAVPAGATFTGIAASGVTFNLLRRTNIDSTTDSEIWCGVVASGGSAAVTGTTSGTAYLIAFLVTAEFSGASTCTAESVTGNSGNSNTLTTGSVTATGADLVFAAGSVSGSINSGPTNSFTTLTTSSQTLTRAAYQIETGSGTYSTGWGTTGGGAGPWNTSIVAINPVPPLTVAPTTIPAGHSGNITLTLTGSGTSWGGGTTFTASGVANVTKISQNVTSATAATLVVTTGAGTGTLTISDGTNTSPIQVASTTFAISLAVPNSAAPTTITFTGTNTIWLSETASSLFSLSGGLGASISTPTVTTDLTATATLTMGSTAGQLTVTDTSVSNSVTVPINSSSGPKTEAYFESTFLAVTQNLLFIQSLDGIAWTNYTKTTPTITGVRDPSFIEIGGTSAVAYNDNTQGNISTITLYTGNSISNLSLLAYVPVYAAQPAWAPRFFLDPVSPGTLYMIVSTPAATYGVSLLSASLSNLSSWSAPAIILPYATGGYDGSLLKVGSTYYLFYAIANQGLYYRTSSSIGGTYSGEVLLVAGIYESPVTSYSPITGYRLYFTAAGGDNGGFQVPLNLSGGAFSTNGTPARFYLNGATQTQNGTVTNYGPIVPGALQ